MKTKIFALLLCLAGNALAFTTTTPASINNVQWTVTGTTGTESAKNICTTLSVDITGGSRFMVYGVLLCNNTGTSYTTYGVTGTGFVKPEGGIAMFLSVGSQFYWTCSTNAQFGANCTAVNVVTFTQVGTPVIALVP